MKKSSEKATTETMKERRE